MIIGALKLYRGQFISKFHTRNTPMANKQDVALDAFCGPNCDLYIASVTIAMHAKVYVIPTAQ